MGEDTDTTPLTQQKWFQPALIALITALVTLSGTLYATHRSAQIEARHVDVKEAEVTIAGESLQLDEWTKLIDNLRKEVQYLQNQLTTLRAENGELRQQIRRLTEQLNRINQQALLPESAIPSSSLGEMMIEEVAPMRPIIASRLEPERIPIYEGHEVLVAGAPYRLENDVGSPYPPEGGRLDTLRAHFGIKPRTWLDYALLLQLHLLPQPAEP